MSPIDSVFDPRKLEEHITRSESRAVAILDIVQRLVDAGLKPVAEIRAVFHLGQHQQAAHRLRTLCGSVANLGGRRVCEVAEELEQLLEREAANLVIDELMNCLEREFNQFLKNAELWLHARRRAFDVSGNRPKTWELRLQQLLECLRQNNLQAFDLFEELEMQLRQLLPPTDFLDLYQALQALDFPTALRVIETTTAARDAPSG